MFITPEVKQLAHFVLLPKVRFLQLNFTYIPTIQQSIHIYIYICLRPNTKLTQLQGAQTISSIKTQSLPFKITAF